MVSVECGVTSLPNEIAMKRTTELLHFVVLVFVLSGCEQPNQVDAASFPADNVFLHGGIYTVHAEQPWAEAAAVRGDEIIYVGSNSGAEALIGPDTQVHNLTGRMLLPGFHDSHVHLLGGGMLETGCKLTGLISLAEIRKRLIECRGRPGIGSVGWVTGGNWDREPFSGGVPDKELLDEIFPDRPAFLYSLDGHTAWVNSNALKIAGIDRSTVDPTQGRIARDPQSGELTGILDEAAMDMVGDFVPELAEEETEAALQAAISLAHEYGITSVIEPGLDHDMMQPFVALSRAGDLKLRTIVSMSPINWTPGAFGPEVHEMILDREQYRGPNLNPDSIKFYMDGVLETGTALLVDPYVNEDFDRSKPFYSQELLNDYFTRIDREGLQIHVHAIGDLATRMALDAFEAARAANGETGNRHQIVHLQLIHADDIARFGELNIGATFQAIWAYPDFWIMELNLPEVGPERVERMYPIASVKKAGGRIVGGSDWFVSSLNPLDAIETGVRRQQIGLEGGEILNADERVDLATMIAAYTINGAYIHDQDDLVGSIEVGKKADLIVLDRNLFEVPVHQINEAKVLMTLFNGAVVYQQPGDSQ